MRWQWLKFAFLNTLRNRRRSSVTVAIASLGTAAILLAGGFALFTYQGLAQISARTTGHLIVAKPAQFQRDEDTPLQHGLDDVAAVKAKLMADPDVRQVLPRVEFTGLVSNGDKSTVMMAAGIDPDPEFAVKGPFLKVTAGEVLVGSEHGKVMLGEGLARSLKATPGSGLTLLASTTDGALNALDVTVQGVFSTGVPDLDKRLVYTDLATAQKLVVTQRVTSLGVFLRSMEATDPARARVAAALPDLAVQTWVDQAVFYKSVKELYNRIFGALGLIIGVIVVFVVTNAMAMAIIERTREIGTLRAIGMQRGEVLWMFLLESLMLGLLATVAGALFGAAVAAGLNAAHIPVPHGLQFFLMSPHLHLSVHGSLLVSAIVAITIVTGVAAFYPSLKAARLRPVVAMSHFG